MRLFPALLLPAAIAAADPAEFFEKKIRPLFAAKCSACHGAKVKMGGLDLSDSESFRTVLGDGKRLHSAVLYTEKTKMPPAGKLTDPEIADIAKWIEMGAPWPAGAASKPAAAGWKRGTADHWSFRPVQPQTPPSVRDESWIETTVDRFVLARLEAAGLAPAPPAPKLALLRRVTFDLTGLPPTPAEIREFLEDTSPGAYRRVVERLLASPRYGEKWGRHWLDVARYADSTGMDEDHMYPHAWRYRDWVVASFNKDKPYDRFLQEQIAGDLLDGGNNNEALIGTGFLALGPKPLAQQDRVKMVYDVVDEQIDTLSKSVLGLSIACARCHDHKFDPIQTRDYYGLAGIFANTKAFRNNGRFGAVSYLYYAPLDRAAHARWQDHRARMYAKQIAMEEALGSEFEAWARASAAKLPPYLEAAWRVTYRKANLIDTAARENLDFAMLDSLVCLLKDGGKHWDGWRNATGETIAEAAAGYAKRFEEGAKKWNERLSGWRKRYAIEVKEDRDLPARPALAPGDVFGDLAAAGRPLAYADSTAVSELRKEWTALEKTLPKEPEMASAVGDGPPVEQRIFLRGDHHSPGEPAPKAVPAVLAGVRPAVIETRGSGRLELARWITDPANPLTARVMVNRIWQGHFGDGIVRTANNWGSTGEKPTHPELLDWLARRFVDSGWSIKEMHREIAMSNAYRMSAAISPAAREKDPSNRLWSRFARRRMTIEELRDSMLAIDGSLDPAMGGSLMSATERRKATKPDDSVRRTLYMPVRRGSVPVMLAAFDYGDATTPSEGRTRTNVAPQALFLMNSAFVRNRSEALAKALLATAGDDSARVENLYLRTLGRPASANESDDAMSYVAAMEKRLESREKAWASYCRVVLSANEFIFLD